MKIKLITFSAILLCTAISFAQPVMPHQPMINPWYGQPQPQQSIWEKGLSLLGNDTIDRGINGLYIAGMVAAGYLIKDAPRTPWYSKVGFAVMAPGVIMATAASVLMAPIIAHEIICSAF